MVVPELLAPAGGMDALYAALAAGADAVYTGLGRMDARAASPGLTFDELGRTCRLAHARGARVYVTLNAYVRDDELDEGVHLAMRALDAGADALIMADVGFIWRVLEEVPNAEVHLSTQVGVHSPDGARLAARELGCARVTVGRELSIPEIARICGTGVPVEVFCHGAICICYSGACAFSALRHGRSANRGDCTQPCRAAYVLEDDGGRVVAGGAEGVVCEGDRLLCPRDHLGIAHVGELARAGVASLKIEGRMKNPDYVYNTTACYREALDAVGEGRAYDAGALARRLEHSFNRGFTDAYLRGEHGAGLGAGFMSFERSSNQGSYVGELMGQWHDEAVVELACPVHAGDVLEIRSTPGGHTFPGVPKRWPQVPCPSDGEAGEQLRVHCKRRVEPGSAVHVVRSAWLLEETDAAVTAIRKEERRIEEEGEGNAASDMESDAPTKGDADGYAARKSARRSAHFVISSGPELADAHSAGQVPAAALVTGPSVRVVVACSTVEDVKAALEDPRASEVAVHARCILSDSLGVEHAVISPVWDALLPRLAVILGETARETDTALLLAMCGRAGAVVCRNLGQIETARAAGVPWEAAAPIQVWNAGTVRFLARLGARRVWLPDELSVAEDCAVARAVAREVPLGVLLKGRPELMVTEHCLLTAEGPCAGNCPSCARRTAAAQGGRFLVGSDGVCLPLEVDSHGRTRIYDAAPFDRTDSVRELERAGVSSFLIAES